MSVSVNNVIYKDSDSHVGLLFINRWWQVTYSVTIHCKSTDPLLCKLLLSIWKFPNFWLFATVQLLYIMRTCPDLNLVSAQKPKLTDFLELINLKCNRNESNITTLNFHIFNQKEKRNWIVFVFLLQSSLIHRC